MLYLTYAAPFQFSILKVTFINIPIRIHNLSFAVSLPVLPEALVVFVRGVNIPAKPMDLILVEFALVHALLGDAKPPYSFLFSLAINLPVVLLVIHNFVALNYRQVHVYINEIFLKQVV